MNHGDHISTPRDGQAAVSSRVSSVRVWEASKQRLSVPHLDRLSLLTVLNDYVGTPNNGLLTGAPMLQQRPWNSGIPAILYHDLWQPH